MHDAKPLPATLARLKKTFKNAGFEFDEDQTLQTNLKAVIKDLVDKHGTPDAIFKTKRAQAFIISVDNTEQCSDRAWRQFFNTIDQQKIFEINHERLQGFLALAGYVLGKEIVIPAPVFIDESNDDVVPALDWDDDWDNERTEFSKGGFSAALDTTTALQIPPVDIEVPKKPARPTPSARQVRRVTSMAAADAPTDRLVPVLDQKSTASTGQPSPTIQARQKFAKELQRPVARRARQRPAKTLTTAATVSFIPETITVQNVVAARNVYNKYFASFLESLERRVLRDDNFELDKARFLDAILGGIELVCQALDLKKAAFFQAAVIRLLNGEETFMTAPDTVDAAEDFIHCGDVFVRAATASEIDNLKNFILQTLDAEGRRTPQAYQCLNAPTLKIILGEVIDCAKRMNRAPLSRPENKTLETT